MCLADTINFDSLSGPVALTNQFAAQGLIFDQIEATNQFATSVVTVSAPTTRLLSIPTLTPVCFRLWILRTTIWRMDSVSITLNGYNNVGGWFDGATIEALDASGSVIAGQTQTVNPSNGTNYGPTTITFTGDVHALEFINIPNASRLGILPFDDVTFGTLTDTPEPSAFLLMGASLLAVSLARRKKA